MKNLQSEKYMNDEIKNSDIQQEQFTVDTSNSKEIKSRYKVSADNAKIRHPEDSLEYAKNFQHGSINDIGFGRHNQEVLRRDLLNDLDYSDDYDVYEVRKKSDYY